MLKKVWMKMHGAVQRFLGSWHVANIVLACCCLIMLAAAIHSELRDPGRYGFDLRNRIVGARLLQAGRDPYRQYDLYANGQYPIPAWSDPALLSLGGIESRTTVPPPGLRVYQLFDSGDWVTVECFWNAVNWLLLIGVILGFALTAQTPYGRILSGLLLGPAILKTQAFRIHTNLGQSYLFIGALIAIDVILLLRNRAAFAGWAAGAAAIFRPQLVLAAVVFWFLGHRRAAAQTCLLATLLLGGSAVMDAPLWASFSRNVDQWVALTMKEQAALDEAVFKTDWRDKMPEAAALALKDGYDITHFAKNKLATMERAEQTPFSNKKSQWLAHILFGEHWRLHAAMMLVAIAAFLAWTAHRCSDGMLAGAAALAAVPLLTELPNPVVHVYMAMANLPLFGVACLAAGDRRHALVLVALTGCLLIMWKYYLSTVDAEVILLLVLLYGTLPPKLSRRPAP